MFGFCIGNVWILYWKCLDFAEDQRRAAGGRSFSLFYSIYALCCSIPAPFYSISLYFNPIFLDLFLLRFSISNFSHHRSHLASVGWRAGLCMNIPLKLMNFALK